MFEPTAVPNGEGLRGWLARQFRDVADTLAAPEVRGVRFSLLAAEPARYTNGDLVAADGTNWNPGGGAGLYQRIGGAWVKL